MKLSSKIATLAVAVVLSVAALTGCGSVSDSPDLNTNVPEGASPVMPLGHEGRYASLGVDGCYGCHGSNGEADPMLNGAYAMPDNHYVNGDRSTMEVDPSRVVCISCHVQGTAPAAKE